MADGRCCVNVDVACLQVRRAVEGSRAEEGRIVRFLESRESQRCLADRIDESPVSIDHHPTSTHPHDILATCSPYPCFNIPSTNALKLPGQARSDLPAQSHVYTYAWCFSNREESMVEGFEPAWTASSYATHIPHTPAGQGEARSSHV